MAFRESTQITVLTGVSSVAVAGPPNANEVIVVRGISVDNKDSRAISVTVHYRVSGVPYEVGEILAVPVGEGDILAMGSNRLVLDSPNNTIECIMSLGILTTAPVVTVHMATEN